MRFRCPWFHPVRRAAVVRHARRRPPAVGIEVASSPVRRQRGGAAGCDGRHEFALESARKRERNAAMRVLCTNGLKSVMLDLSPDFERTIGTKVVITWGSANGLLKELETGAGGDLAILTAEAIDDLIKAGQGRRRQPRRSRPLRHRHRRAQGREQARHRHARRAQARAAGGQVGRPFQDRHERHLFSDRAGAARHRRRDEAARS